MQSVTRSVLARAVKMLARSGLILAVLPVRAAAIPQAEGSGRAQVVAPSGVNSTNCRLIYVVATQAHGRRRFTGPAFATIP